MDEDIVITGVVVANDISGNLYQTLLIRNMEPSGEDQCIILGVKNTCLYPYFQLGQRIKVNLKGLWVGVYSQVPRIGQPVKSSWDNLNLGPMLFELLRENVELVGRPDPSAPELVPINLTGTEGDAWLRASDNRAYYNTPRLATIQGSIREVKDANRDKLDYGSDPDLPETYGKAEELSPNGKKIFAPYNLHDKGMAVDRTIELYSDKTTPTPDSPRKHTSWALPNATVTTGGWRRKMPSKESLTSAQTILSRKTRSIQNLRL